jgi:hypothetical protein
MSAVVALQVCALLAAIGIVVDAAEMHASRAAIAARFSWPIVRTSVGRIGTSGPTAVALATIAEPRGAAAFQAVRAAAAVLSAAGWLTGSVWLGAGCALVVLMCQLLVMTRLAYGLDGADQMQTVLWAGLALSAVEPAAGLTLIALQSLLSYLVAGVAKVAGLDWRNGTAPGRIAATRGHGGPRAAAVLTRWSRPAALATIAFEVGGPFLVLGGTAGALVFAVAAVAFHLSIAATMGLNNFVWAFCAALPAVVWLGSVIQI